MRAVDVARLMEEIKERVRERRASGFYSEEEVRRIVQMELELTESAPTLTVPRSAVLWPAGKPLVYVVKGDGVYEPREVQVLTRGFGRETTTLEGEVGA